MIFQDIKISKGIARFIHNTCTNIVMDFYQIITLIFFTGLEKLKAFAQWPKTTLMATKKLTRKWDMEKLLQ